MTEDDIRKIAKEVAKEVAKEAAKDIAKEAAKEAVDEASQRIEEQFHRFWIEPEKHYRSHARADKFMEIWDSTQSTLFKAIIGLVIVGLFTVAALPYILKGKGVS